MRIQIDLPDDKAFKDKISNKAALQGRTRKNYIETLIIEDVYGKGVQVPRSLGRAALGVVTHKVSTDSKK
jgi:hypothetical protein